MEDTLTAAADTPRQPKKDRDRERERGRENNRVRERGDGRRED
jgi:hypothetical protein